MQQSHRKECPPLSTKRRQREIPKRNICDKADAINSISTSVSTLDEDKCKLPKLGFSSTDIIKTILTPELVRVISKMNEYYMKFRKHGTPVYRITMPTSQFYEDCLNAVIKDEMPHFQLKDFEKFEILKIVNDFDHHRFIIRKIVDIYFDKFEENSWNMSKNLATVIGYLMYRMLSPNIFEEMFEVLTNLTSLYRLVPLLHHLIDKDHLYVVNSLGLSVFDYNYVKSMFIISTKEGRDLAQEMFEKIIAEYFLLNDNAMESEKHKVDVNHPFNMEELLGIDKVKFMEVYEERSGDLRGAGVLEAGFVPHEELVDIYASEDMDPDTMIDYSRIINLTFEDGAIDYGIKLDDDKIGNIYYDERQRRNNKRNKKQQDNISHFKAHVQKHVPEAKTTEMKEKRLEVRNKIAEVLRLADEQPWALSQEDRMILERVELEPAWYTADDYTDSTDAIKLGGDRRLTQRRLLELMGVKNHCCNIKVEDKNSGEVIEMPAIKKKPLNYLKSEVNIKKNNASILREVARINKKETDLLTEMQQLEMSNIGLLENRKRILEQEIKDEADKAVALRTKRLIAMLSMERAAAAKKMIIHKNEEQRIMYEEEIKEMESQKKVLDEEDEKRRRKLIEEVQEARDNAQEKLTLIQLDNWAEARAIDDMLLDMKRERQKEIYELNKKRKDEINAKKIFEYLNQRDKKFADVVIKSKSGFSESKNHFNAKQLEIKLMEQRKAEELNRKREKTFQINARRKCMRKSAEEYVESRRSAWKEMRKSADQKNVKNDIVIKSRVVDDLEKQLNYFKKLRQTDKPITEKQLKKYSGRVERTSPPIIEDCIYSEKHGMFLRKILPSVAVNIESEQLKNIKKTLEKEPDTVTQLKVDIPSKMKDMLVKKPPPVTSLTTFYSALFNELHWKELTPTSDELYELKQKKMADIYQEKEYFKQLTEVPAIKETKFVEFPVPVLIQGTGGRIHINNEGAIVLKQPLMEDHVIIRGELLKNMTDLLRLFTKIRNIAMKKKQMTDKAYSLKSVFSVFRNEFDPDPDEDDDKDDEDYDQSYFQGRRFLMAPMMQTRLQIEEAPADTGELEVKSSASVKKLKKKGLKADRSVDRKLAVEWRKALTEKSTTSTTGSRIKSRSSRTRVKSSVEDDFFDNISTSSWDSSDGKLEEEESEDLRKYRDEIAESDYIGTESAVRKRYENVVESLDLSMENMQIPTVTFPDISELNAVAEQKTSEAPKLTDRIDRMQSDVKPIIGIPSSTALEYLHRMSSEEETSASEEEETETAIAGTSEKKRKTKREATASMLLSDLLIKLKKDKKFRKQYLELKKGLDLRTIKKPIHFFKANPREFFYKFIRRQKSEPSLHRPKVYPPFVLQETPSTVVKIGTHPAMRFRGRRIIVPGYCHYIQKKDLYNNEIIEGKLKQPKKKKGIKIKNLTRKAICMREKFREIDQLLLARFPPPYGEDSLIPQYFPSLKPETEMNLVRRIVQEQRQQMAMPISSIHRESRLSYAPLLRRKSKSKQTRKISGRFQPDSQVNFRYESKVDPCVKQTYECPKIEVLSCSSFRNKVKVNEIDKNNKKCSLPPIRNCQFPKPQDSRSSIKSLSLTTLPEIKLPKKCEMKTRESDVKLPPLGKNCFCRKSLE